MGFASSCSSAPGIVIFFFDFTAGRFWLRITKVCPSLSPQAIVLIHRTFAVAFDWLIGLLLKTKEHNF